MLYIYSSFMSCMSYADCSAAIKREKTYVSPVMEETNFQMYTYSMNNIHVLIFLTSKHFVGANVFQQVAGQGAEDASATNGENVGPKKVSYGM